MTKRRPRTNIILVAFAAIVGMFSFADVASACSVKPVSAPRACCASRPPGECGCCGEGQALALASPGTRVDAAISSSVRIVTQASTPSCECRASEPAAPSERPAQRTGVDRPDAGSGESLCAVEPSSCPTFRPALQLLANESPPRSPLYLRTSRLLI
jgi:hypothetical protein